jgi:uncharacterized protein (UPF0261 family)
MYEPESDRGFIEGLKEGLERKEMKNVSVETLDLHINDPAFAETAARNLHALIEARGRS